MVQREVEGGTRSELQTVDKLTAVVLNDKLIVRYIDSIGHIVGVFDEEKDAGPQNLLARGSEDEGER